MDKHILGLKWQIYQVEQTPVSKLILDNWVKLHLFQNKIEREEMKFR